MKKYDAVVIGAGNGGLVAAIRILQKGKSVLVLERWNTPGGFATSFKRGRFEFEASLHELNDYGPADNPGDVRKLFEELGVHDKIDWIESREAYRVITLDGKYDARIKLGKEGYKQSLEKYCPGCGKYIDDFFAIAEEIRLAQAYTASVNGVTDKEYMKKHFPNFIRVGSYSVNEAFRAMGFPQKLIDIMNAYWCYLGAHCDDLSFIHYCSMVYRYVIRYAYMPKARSHELSLAFDQRIRELGGDIWYNSCVTRILTDKDKNICGVELADGTRVETRYIVANCSPHVVYGQLMDPAAVPEEAIKNCNTRKFAGRGFCMFLGLNKSPQELGITDHSYFIYNSMDTAKEYETMKKISTNNCQATCCLNLANPECSPEGTTMMYFTTLFTSDDWANVSEKDYTRVKNEVGSRMIDVFEKATGIKIRDSIEEVAIATPMTYARYCGHPEGTIYGYESQYWDGLMPRLQMMREEVYVKGLRFAGGWSMRLSGYSSAYNSGDIVGRQTAGDLVREDK